MVNGQSRVIVPLTGVLQVVKQRKRKYYCCVLLPFMVASYLRHFVVGQKVLANRNRCLFIDQLSFARERRVSFARGERSSEQTSFPPSGTSSHVER